MRHLSKIVVTATALALSLSCISAYAAPSTSNMGRIANKNSSVKTEVKMHQKFELTDETKAAKIEEIKADLAAKLEAGEITQEEYDEKLAEIETGNFKYGRKNGKGQKKETPEKVEVTDEEKAAKIEERKADLAAKLEAGEITQEEYDEKLAKIESGDFKPEFKGKKDANEGKANKDMKCGKGKAPKMNKATDTEDTAETDESVVSDEAVVIE